MWDTVVRPSTEEAQRFYDNGWWRSKTFLDDLDRAARERADVAAIITYEHGQPARQLTYGELAPTVDRFAAALVELGVQPGQVVVVHLPNWWMLTPLFLACARIGAVSAPVVPSLGARELGQVLAGSQAPVCIIPESYAGTDYVERLERVAPESLRHRVVVHTGQSQREGVVDFAEFFGRETLALAPQPARHGDDIALLLYTSGTTGEPKAVAHSFNTLYAASRALSDLYGLDESTVVTIPHYLTHMAALTMSAYMSIVLGSTCVMQDDSDMGLMLDLVERHKVTVGYAAPMFVMGLLKAQRERPRDVSSLGNLVSGSAPIPPDLIAQTRDVLGVELRALWGMTENGGATLTRADDPPGWAAHSDGSPVPWMQVRIAAEEGEEIGKLLIRGAAQCLGYVGQRATYLAQLDDEGWFDTGDTCRPDGRGGIRITGRRADLITRRWANKVPTLEVEGVLVRHPAIKEVVLIGYPDTEVPGAEHVAAVVVPEGDAPSVEELQKYLDSEGMTWENWPDKVVVVEALPKNSLGKVLRPILRDQVH